MMLHLQRKTVKTDAITNFPSIAEELEARGSRILPTGPAAFAWLAGDLNPLGVVGNAMLASEEIGKTLVAHYATILARIIQDASDFPIEKLNQR
jgi:creatinine amidohydrolase